MLSSRTRRWCAPAGAAAAALPATSAAVAPKPVTTIAMRRSAATLVTRHRVRTGGGYLAARRAAVSVRRRPPPSSSPPHKPEAHCGDAAVLVTVSARRSSTGTRQPPRSHTRLSSRAMSVILGSETTSGFEPSADLGSIDGSSDALLGRHRWVALWCVALVAFTLLVGLPTSRTQIFLFTASGL